MQVTMLTRRLEIKYGGAENSQRHLFNHLKNKVSMKIINIHDDTKSKIDFDAEEVSGKFALLKFLKRMWNNRKETDIFHVHELGKYYRFPVAIFLKVLGKPSVATVYHENLVSGIERRVKLFDEVILNAGYLKRHFKYKCSVIYTPIDVNRFPKHKKKGNRNRLLYYGSPRKGRGMEHLIKAFSHLKGYELLISLNQSFWEDTSRADFISKLATMNDVKCKGRGSVEEMLSNADYFIFPVYDGNTVISVPMSVLEAMASGLTVIAHPVNELPHVISNGKNGYLMDFTSDDSGEKLKKILSSSFLGGNARRTIEQLCNPDKIIGEHLKIYEKSLKGRQRPQKKRR